ncbi:LysR family transcriptional regulator [Afifella sp. IM 167]|uniref:LysR family transcriptional regulator n=1 Tax=Afifella sp. IM 167 TaxID=2033586 RepID=UPI001CCAC993|nr:LysR family transcriptional regulator [Afifella sp. IM 167]MBZ8134285.1 LysR family transcriptional regulator [Afifella sp. IM 167]
MDVKSLYTLVAVADCGSFAEAGQRLGLSVSSVSLHVRALEEETGLLLFDRHTRPPRLTEEGRDFVQRAREVLAHWEALSEGLTRDPARGVLKIGAVHTTVAGAVPGALRRLQATHPEMHMRLATGLTHDLEGQVRHRLLDCAIVTSPELEEPDLTFFPVAEEPLVVIAHRSVKGRTDREILQSEPYVRFNRRARVARQVERELASLGISVSSRMEIDTLDAVVALVGSALGVSVVPLHAGGQTFPDEIRSVPFGSPPILRRLGVVMRADCAKAHLVSLLVKELRFTYGAPPEKSEEEDAPRQARG